MSNLKQYRGIIVSSTNAPHDTFQRNTPRAARFNVCLSKHALGFALIWAISATSMAFAGEIITSTNGTMGPLAPVLSTKVIVQGTDNQEQTESFVFEVPKAGEAVLRIVNGAKKGAALSERVQGVELALNDKVIVNPKSFSDKTDILETRVFVWKGMNRLEIKLLAQANQRVALRIGAPADKIIVAPVNAIVLRSEPLLARATVTGLGLPVPHAKVQFEVRGLGPIIHENATTSNSGIATAYISGFDAGRRGRLRATSGAGLSNLVSFTVSKKGVLTVKQRPESVELEAEAPYPLILSSPFISPSRIAPGPDKIPVAFNASITGSSEPPTELVLEKKLSDGKFLPVTETKLLDNGTESDAKAGDGIYSGMLELGSQKEPGLYFRVSAVVREADYSEKTVTSEAVFFPITKLTTRAPSSEALVSTKDRQYQIYANEVILSTVAGVAPKRVQAIISEVRDSLGPVLETIEIVGYIPSINAYRVEFKRHESFKWYEIFERHKSLDGVKTLMEAFKEYEEIESASPNAAFKPAASTGQWYLDHIGIDKLREGGGPPLGRIARRVHSSPYGSSSIGVAIYDFAVDCASPLLPERERCVRPANPPSECPQGLFDDRSSLHGTRSAALIAGKSPSLGDVAQGVAWNTTLFPLTASNSWTFSEVIECVRALKGRGRSIHILNFSGEIPDDLEGNVLLGASVCKAVCNDLLLVASAGNVGCAEAMPRKVYPASFNEELGCSCMGGGNAETFQLRTSNRILKVGGLNINGQRGNSCTSDGTRTREGEIWAPGWGIPAPNRHLPNGTSWSAALVSGCAAVYGAYQLGGGTDGTPWNPTAIHYGLLKKATGVGNKKHLNCSAVSEP